MYKKYFKRMLDVIFSLLLLLLLIPALAVLSLTILFSMGRPVFFCQKRPGLNGVCFKLIKFRTMSEETELSDEERTGRVGRLLRRTHLDELPELYNILRGEMSFVGPRPQLRRDMLFYSKEIMRRQSVLPGLTGLAQSKGSSALVWDVKFKCDLEYVDDITFLGDVKIIAATVKTVLFHRFDDNSPCGDYGQWLLRLGKITQEEFDEIMRGEGK